MSEERVKGYIIPHPFSKVDARSKGMEVKYSGKLVDGRYVVAKYPYTSLKAPPVSALDAVNYIMHVWLCDALIFLVQMSRPWHYSG